jgi:hypothetical protein
LAMNTVYPQEAKMSSDTGKIFVVIKLEKGGIIKECKAFTVNNGISVPVMPEVVIVGYETSGPADLRPGKTTSKATGSEHIALQTECLRVANKLSVTEIPDWNDKDMEFALVFNFVLRAK